VGEVSLCSPASLQSTLFSGSPQPPPAASAPPIAPPPLPPPFIDRPRPAPRADAKTAESSRAIFFVPDSGIVSPARRGGRML